ncbi:family 16 glycosyl hydrolase [Coprinopsis sp. MPI-PUGE-AT-0042]|nr:family 16 glycosyl hydrolase [Coprinopsis sp. MPI-PUGE-AT-0042]
MALSRLFWLTTLTTTTITTLVNAQESPRPSSAVSSAAASASSSATARPNWGDIPEEWDRNNDGSPFVWLIEDDYKGKDFFDHFLFFTGHDPTNGLVNYVPREEAFARNLSYVRDDGVVIIKADDTNWLPMGTNRPSVRVETLKEYTTGLFILDAETAPWGCGVWPAWWSTSRSVTPWPVAGEIDIIEGVHDNEHNQVAWHTGPNCHLDLSDNSTYSGNITVKDGVAWDCDTRDYTNYAGCSVTEWSRASYGLEFDEQGGGVFAMKWDENGIAVWSFYRSAVPPDIGEGKPNPRKWGKPSAFLPSKTCDIETNFKNHTVIINITFCGDWAGNSYASSGCPGSCPERLMDPKNFENATWSLNSLKIYKKQLINAVLVDPSSAYGLRTPTIMGIATLLVALCLLL